MNGNYWSTSSFKGYLFHLGKPAKVSRCAELFLLQGGNWNPGHKRTPWRAWSAPLMSTVKIPIHDHPLPSLHLGLTRLMPTAVGRANFGPETKCCLSLKQGRITNIESPAAFQQWKEVTPEGKFLLSVVCLSLELAELLQKVELNFLSFVAPKLITLGGTVKSHILTVR